MKKADARMLRELSTLVKESEKNLKAQWRKIPAKHKEQERRRIKLAIEQLKIQRKVQHQDRAHLDQEIGVTQQKLRSSRGEVVAEIIAEALGR